MPFIDEGEEREQGKREQESEPEHECKPFTV